MCLMYLKHIKYQRKTKIFARGQISKAGWRMLWRYFVHKRLFLKTLEMRPWEWLTRIVGGVLTGWFILRCSCYCAMAPTQYLRLLLRYSSSKQFFSYIDKNCQYISYFFANIVHTFTGRTERIGYWTLYHSRILSWGAASSLGTHSGVNPNSNTKTEQVHFPKCCLQYKSTEE